MGSGWESAGSSSRSTLGSWVKQPPNLLLPQARTLYIVLMLLFSCLADGHTAAARITLPQIHQILWPGIKSEGAERDRKCLKSVKRLWVHMGFSFDI